MGRQVFSNEYRRIFNQRANEYQNAMRNYPGARDVEFEIAVELADVAIGQMVIDFPSGGGYLSRYLPGDTVLYHLEASEIFTKLGKQASDHPFVLVEADQMPFKSNSVDRFVSIAGLHHLECKTSLYKEIYRILKPGGIAVIADVNAGSEPAIFLDSYVDANNDLGHKGFYFNSETRPSIESVGLKVINDQVHRYAWLFAKEKDLARYCCDLFGLNVLSLDNVLDGIGSYLKLGSVDGVTAMEWSLRYLKLVKPY